MSVKVYEEHPAFDLLVRAEKAWAYDDEAAKSRAYLILGQLAQAGHVSPGEWVAGQYLVRVTPKPCDDGSEDPEHAARRVRRNLKISRTAQDKA